MSLLKGSISLIFVLLFSSVQSPVAQEFVELIRLTNDPGEDWDPDWSPNGAKIAFSSNRYDTLSTGQHEIFLMNDDGSDPTKIGFFGMNPAWGIDGKQIAVGFAGYIRIVNIDPLWWYSISNNLTSAKDQGSPTWSPDGSKIAFTALRHGCCDRDHNIWVKEASGEGHEVLLTKGEEEEDERPAWSPDGSKIAFQTRRDDNWEIYTMKPDGSDPVRLTDNLFADYDPAWSPDGSRIAFSSNRHGNMEIYVMDADGSNPIRITNHADVDRSPDWSPDGSKIVFMSDRDGNYEIYVGVLGEPNTGPVVTSVEVTPSRVPQGETISVRATGTTLSE